MKNVKQSNNIMKYINYKKDVGINVYNTAQLYILIFNS